MNAMPMKTTRDIQAGVPWSPYTLPAGTEVWAIPADNLPDDSPIKYWLEPPDGDASTWACHAYGYGVAAYADDVTRDV